jgi:hypothetical protein
MIKQTNDKTTKEILIDKKIKRMEKFLITQSPLSNSFHAIYSDFQLIDSIYFANKINFLIKYLNDAGITYNSIYLEFNKIDLNDKELKFPFNVPHRFSK